MKKLLLSTVIVIVVFLSFIQSPISYLLISFNNSLTPEEYLDYLKDNGIDPNKHKVYVINSAIDDYEAIYNVDGIKKGKRNIADTVFNTKFYALKALSDSRVKEWKWTILNNPYD